MALREASLEKQAKRLERSEEVPWGRCADLPLPGGGAINICQNNF
ncbi:hypothetical protein ACFL20_11900 [Spirochaetota bacterium]